MSNYSAGRQFEYKVRDELIMAGYWCIRAAGSKGAADLVAIKAIQTSTQFSEKSLLPYPVGQHQVLLVQVKKMGAAFPGREWNALLDLAVQLCAIPVLAKKEARGAPIEFWRIAGPAAGRVRPAERLNLLG